MLAGLSVALVSPRAPRAAIATDDAGRPIAIPAKIKHIFAAGPAASILLYTFAPEYVALSTGEVLALGPNGGGKTTRLKTLLGLLPAQGGEVKLGGRSLSNYSSRERARLIAYVPQSHFTTFAFTVEAIVLMGRTAHGALFNGPSAADRAVAARALERFGIGHLRQRPYTMISGGERQLALLARALAQEPQFIVLDEPTASLDFGNQGRLMREIQALKSSGHGVLFTTHDPNQAMRAADRVYLLRQGARIAEGASGIILNRVQLEALRFSHRGHR